MAVYQSKNQYQSKATNLKPNVKAKESMGGIPQSSATNPKAANYKGPGAYSVNSKTLGASTTYNPPSGGGGGSKTSSSTSSGITDQDRAELDELGTQYDYNKSLLEGQLKDYEGQYNTSKSILEQALESVLTSSKRARERSQFDAESNIAEGASAAQQATTKTRNALRGLGILNSSAAGELLSRPGTEFQKVKADIGTQLAQRMKDLDDFEMEKSNENALRISQLTQQYNAMVDRIRTDLRFNEKDKINAMRQAKAALDSRLSEVKASQAEMQNIVDTERNNMNTQFAGKFGGGTGITAAYNAPAQGYVPQGTNYAPQQVGFDQKRRYEMMGATDSYTPDTRQNILMQSYGF